MEREGLGAARWATEIAGVVRNRPATEAAEKGIGLDREREHSRERRERMRGRERDRVGPAR